MTAAHPPNITPYQGIYPQIGAGVYIHPAAQIIGDVVLGENASIWPGTVIRGDVNSIRIGAGTNVQDLSVLHVSHKSGRDEGGAPLVIGRLVTIGHRCILHGCEIGDECLIGMGAIVMDHVVIQPRVLIGAGSLVPEGKQLKSGSLYHGNPVRRVRSLTDAELAYFAYAARHYIELKNDYLGDSTG